MIAIRHSHAEHLKFVGKVPGETLCTTCTHMHASNVGTFVVEGKELRQRHRGSLPVTRDENAFKSHRVIECNELLFVEQCHSVGSGFQRKRDELIYCTYRAPFLLFVENGKCLNVCDRPGEQCQKEEGNDRDPFFRYVRAVSLLKFGYIDGSTPFICLPNFEACSSYATVESRN